ncbi:MAG: hypothetical protein JXR48_06130 [Candidatus Delongbacteria bacterium]|nr:hypothetical protein [Candidatus Delongbacteria bacterium]MBN2834529.1 hypothetical protein [Candidatus Delongbacteria bacterium]
MNKETAIKDIEFIKNQIELSKKKLLVMSYDAVYWGIIVFIGLMYSYFEALYRFGYYSFYVWISIIFIGWGFQYYHEKFGKRVRIRTFSSKILNSVWVGAGVTMTLIALSSMLTYSTNKFVNPIAIAPLIGLVLGMSYFVTGVLTESKVMIFFSIIWWISSFSMLFITSIHILPSFASLILLLQVIPGIMFNRKNRFE